tara:strand:+ start:1047 stop:1274 length:228 start_codon:yes stop_codon:yes gene_type:complete
LASDDGVLVDFCDTCISCKKNAIILAGREIDAINANIVLCLPLCCGGLRWTGLFLAAAVINIVRNLTVGGLFTNG